MFFAQLTMMPPEEIEQLHGISFQEWISRHRIPRSLYAFLVSNCCDGMFMVPVDQLEAAEAIKSLQDMFLRHGGMFCRGGFGSVAEAYCEAVRRHGGTVLMKTKTEQILVADGAVTGVVTSAGNVQRADRHQQCRLAADGSEIARRAGLSTRTTGSTCSAWSPHGHCSAIATSCASR